VISGYFAVEIGDVEEPDPLLRIQADKPRWETP
jgi:hypothetical protein